MEKYYVSGCKDNGSETVTCDDSEAQFWTLYVRDDAGLSQGMIDLAFREDAETAMAVYVERDALQEHLSNYSMSAGQADQRKAESNAVRVALGFAADADDVAPCDLVDAIAALQEQVRELAAEVIYLRSAHPQPFGREMMKAIDAYIAKEDETPESGMLDAFFILRDSIVIKQEQTDAVIREIRAQAVEEYAATVGAVKNGASYAARIRSGEQP